LQTYSCTHPYLSVPMRWYAPASQAPPPEEPNRATLGNDLFFGLSERLHALRNWATDTANVAVAALLDDQRPARAAHGRLGLCPCVLCVCMCGCVCVYVCIHTHTRAHVHMHPHSITQCRTPIASAIPGAPVSFCCKMYSFPIHASYRNKHTRLPQRERAACA
jgi:hypothetical protein